MAVSSSSRGSASWSRSSRGEYTFICIHWQFPCRGKRPSDTQLTCHQVRVPASGTNKTTLCDSDRLKHANSSQLTLTIKKDLKLTPTEIANSNIVALTATYVPSSPSLVYTLRRQRRDRENKSRKGLTN